MDKYKEREDKFKPVFCILQADFPSKAGLREQRMGHRYKKLFWPRQEKVKDYISQSYQTDISGWIYGFFSARTDWIHKPLGYHLAPVHDCQKNLLIVGWFATCH